MHPHDRKDAKRKKLVVTAEGLHREYRCAHTMNFKSSKPEKQNQCPEIFVCVTNWGKCKTGLGIFGFILYYIEISLK